MSDQRTFKKHILPSGLTIFFQHLDIPWFISCIIIHAGTYDDPIPGTAHLLEHRINAGTTGYPAMNLQQRGEWCDTRGYFLNHGETGTYHTLYGGKTLNENAAHFLRFLSEFVQNPSYTLPIQRDRDIIKRERDSKRSARSERIYRKRLQAFFGDHPITKMNGCPSDQILEQITDQLLREFHTRYYQPHNMSLVIMGGLDEDEILKTLGGIFPLHQEEKIQPAHTPFPTLRGPDPRQHHEPLASEVETIKSIELTWDWILPKGIIEVDSVISRLVRTSLKNLITEQLRENFQMVYGVSASCAPNKHTVEFTIQTRTDPSKAKVAIREVERLLEQPDIVMAEALRLQKTVSLEYLLKDQAIYKRISEAADDITTYGRPLTDAEQAEWFLNINDSMIEEFLEDIAPKNAFLVTRERS